MGVNTYVDLLRMHAADRPDAPAVIVTRPSDRLREDESITYGQLDQRSRRIASWLSGFCRVGDRALLLFPTGVEFVEYFFGCLYAGVIPVPAPVPEASAQRDGGRTVGICQDAEAAIVLTCRTYAVQAGEMLRSAGLEAIRVMAVEDVELGDLNGWVEPHCGSESVAFLQYTSGSVTSPKGVVVSHANLIGNEQMACERFGLNKDTPVGGWLPLFHDMGLIGTLLLPIFCGSYAVLMPPSEFARGPINWLSVIDLHGLHLSAAPNFAYDYCTRRVTDEQLLGLDLSRWRCAVNGSEPIDARTIRRFADRFSAAGFRQESLCPSYGLAEATLLVTGSSVDAAPVVISVDADLIESGVLAESVEEGNGKRARLLVGCGGLWTDEETLELRVVDPASGRELPEDQVGEICLRGGSVTSGYWDVGGNGQALAVRRHDAWRGFLKTGDLGALHDGQLFVTGRIKELILLRGRNIYPRDVEITVAACHDAFVGLRGAAFALADPPERVVVVQELKWSSPPPDGLERLASQVQEALRVEFGFARACVVFVRARTVRLTTSGKVRRDYMREQFMEDRLQSVYESLDSHTRRLYRQAHTAAS